MKEVFQKEQREWIYPLDEKGYIVADSKPEIEVTIQFNRGQIEVLRAVITRLQDELARLIEHPENAL